MNARLHLLIVEDSASDARLLVRHLERAGFAVEWRRVDTAEALIEGLRAGGWDAILADHTMPGFSGPDALRLVREAGCDAPFIFVSGTLGEEVAVEAMKSGAQDYVVKGNLARLVPAIQRELREASSHREHKRAEAALHLQAAALSATSNAIVIAGRDGAIEWANAAFTGLTGYASTDALGQNLCDLLKSGQEEPSLYESLWKTILAGRVWHGELLNRRKDGSLYSEEQSITPVCNTNGAITHFVAIKQDLSERRRAEAALRESEQRFRMITESIEEVFWISDAALREVSYVSPAYERIWGRSRQTLADCPQSFFAVVHAGDQARVRAELDQRGRDQPFGCRYRIERPSGAVRSIWNRGFPVRGIDGSVIHYVGVAEDVTDRERADRELQETRDNYRLLFENAIEGIYQASPDGRLLAANPALARMFGFESAGAMIAATPDVARWWIDPAARAEFVRRAESEGAVAGFEWEGRRPDGSRFWVVENGRCVRGKSGRVLRYDGTLEDITEARRAALQQKLKHEIATILARSASSSEAYPLVLQALGTELDWDCGQLWLVDRTGNGMRCAAAWSSGVIDSRQFAAASELASEAPGCGLLGRVCATGACEKGEGGAGASEALMRKFDLRAFMVFPLMLEERRLGVVALYRQRPREGVDFPCALLEVLGTHFAEFIQRQHITEQLRQAQKLEALGNLAGGIAHDFNNVLAAITGYSELAQMDSKGNPTVHSHLEGVLTGARRATALVRQILAFCRQQEQSRRPIQIRQTVGEALRLLRAAAPANIELATDLRGEAPVVLADATQLHQVVMNLATNAVHAMRERGGRLTVAIEDFTADEHAAVVSPDLRPGRYARLTVSDTGHGMDAATRDRIFDPFFTTKPVGEGTGLGLSVVHGIVRAHDGAITVASRPGEGSTFQIYLPAHLGEAEQQVAKTAELPRGRGERVLVVDDEPAIADVSTRVLRALGYAVNACTDPRAAVELIAKDPRAFALVLTDQGMPGMSGVELAQRVHALRADLPVVLTSGYTATLQREELAHLGITELLPKPLTVDDLATVVHRALAAPV